MVDLSHSVLFMGAVGTVTALIGTLAGISLSYRLVSNRDKLKGIILGILGGFMLSIVLVDFLPEAYEFGNLSSSILGLVLGLLFAFLFDNILGKAHIGCHNDVKGKSLQSAIIMSVGIGLHNIPSGMALGALVDVSLANGILLLVALVVHGIPESIALGLFFKECNLKKSTISLISILISLPMGIGSLIGGSVNKLFPYALSISISFAAGLIIYIILGEILPEAYKLRHKKALALEIAVGILTGVAFSFLLH